MRRGGSRVTVRTCRIPRIAPVATEAVEVEAEEAARGEAGLREEIRIRMVSRVISEADPVGSSTSGHSNRRRSSLGLHLPRRHSISTRTATGIRPRTTTVHVPRLTYSRSGDEGCCEAIRCLAMRNVWIIYLSTAFLEQSTTGTGHRLVNAGGPACLNAFWVVWDCMN